VIIVNYKIILIMCAAKGWLVSHRRSVHDDEAHFRRALSNSNRRESNLNLFPIMTFCASAGLKLNAILYSKAITRLLTHLAGK
jgi:hypothetical protein